MLPCIRERAMTVVSDVSAVEQLVAIDQLPRTPVLISLGNTLDVQLDGVFDLILGSDHTPRYQESGYSFEQASPFGRAYPERTLARKLVSTSVLIIPRQGDAPLRSYRDGVFREIHGLSVPVDTSEMSYVVTVPSLSEGAVSIIPHEKSITINFYEFTPPHGV